MQAPGCECRDDAACSCPWSWSMLGRSWATLPVGHAVPCVCSVQLQAANDGSSACCRAPLGGPCCAMLDRLLRTACAARRRVPRRVRGACEGAAGAEHSLGWRCGSGCCAAAGLGRAGGAAGMRRRARARVRCYSLTRTHKRSQPAALIATAAAVLESSLGSTVSVARKLCGRTSDVRGGFLHTIPAQSTLAGAKSVSNALCNRQGSSFAL